MILKRYFEWYKGSRVKWVKLSGYFKDINNKHEEENAVPAFFSLTNNLFMIYADLC